MYDPQNVNEVPQYFILTSKAMDDELKQSHDKVEQRSQERVAIKGKPFKYIGTDGITFERARKYENQWQNLPERFCLDE